MKLQLVLLSVACFAFLIQPAHSGNLLSMKSTAIRTAADIASIGGKVVKAKGAAVVKAASDIASIVTTGMGLKVRAIGNAASSMTGAVADGFIAVGDSLKKAGDSIVTAKIGTSSSSGSSSSSDSTRFLVRRPVVSEVVENVKVRTPTVVEEKYEEPCAEEVVSVPVKSYPLRSVQMRVREPMTVIESASRGFITNKVSSVWDTVRNAAQRKVNGFGQIFNIGGSPTGRNDVVYEIVDTPRVFQGPLFESFQIQKK